MTNKLMPAFFTGTKYRGGLIEGACLYFSVRTHTLLAVGTLIQLCRLFGDFLLRTYSIFCLLLYGGRGAKLGERHATNCLRFYLARNYLIMGIVILLLVSFFFAIIIMFVRPTTGCIFFYKGFFLLLVRILLSRGLDFLRVFGAYISMFLTKHMFLQRSTKHHLDVITHFQNIIRFYSFGIFHIYIGGIILTHTIYYKWLIILYIFFTRVSLYKTFLFNLICMDTILQMLIYQKYDTIAGYMHF
ncbi:pI243L [African swine fever virus]|uniref:PI243L n=1 Tax=African swine fever virus TaxID=10497 RepID=A0A649YJR0_ASF|nr:pI243L [African swine fever virus]